MTDNTRRRAEPSAPSTALITGASRGIGAAIALNLAQAGTGVMIHYHQSRERAEAVAEACRRQGAAFAETICADIRSLAEIAQMKVTLAERGISPDIVVHSAGTAHYGLLEDLAEQEWDDLQHLHLKAAYGLAKHFAPDMTWRRYGRIIHISSVWGVVGAGGESAYSAAKGGLNSLTKALAKELSFSGVTVNAVAPGLVETDMLEALTAAEQEELLAAIPLGRFAKPEEVAQLVRFLTLGDAGYITGQVISLSGGWQL